MFNNEVNQTYNQQDATLEILIMLGGAFLLGCLLCWLIRKLVASNAADQVTEDTLQSSTQATISAPPQSLSGVRTISRPVSNHAHYSKPKIDDLTKISGINTDIETELRCRGIKTYTDLRDSTKESIVGTIEMAGGKLVSTKEAQTWPHQASLAAKGEWEKLQEYQDFMARTKKATERAQQEAKNTNNSDQNSKNDDLKMIEGIGPKIEEILNNNGIHSFKDLRQSDKKTLKKYLDQAGNRFEKHDPQSWPHQASMAEKGEWEELKIYQEFMDDEETPTVLPISTNIEAEDSQNIVPDDLKKIEGIGPNIEAILNKEGILTFAKLHETDRDTLKSYLDKAGSQFKMHEPESWPQQAGMAATGQWEELIIYQEFMDGSSPSTASITTPSLHIKDTTKAEFDDLKKIEGIGPKIQELLNSAGIKTYEDLKNSKSDDIKKLLDNAGPQYRMHEPKTWPTQANLAFDNLWEELEAYQEEIVNLRANKED